MINLDLWAAVAPVYVLVRWTFLAHFTVTGKENYRKFSAIDLRSPYRIVLHVLNVIVLFLLFISLNFDWYPYDNAVNQYMGKMKIYTSILIFMVSLLFNYKYGVQVLTTLEDIIKVDEKLQKLDIVINNSSTRSINILWLTITGILFTIFEVFRKYDVDFLTLLIIFAYVLAYAQKFVLSNLFRSIVYVLQVRFFIINNYFEKSRNEAINGVTVKKLLRIKLIHQKLCKTVEKFNKQGAWCILVYFGINIFIIVSNFYRLISPDRDYIIMHMTYILIHVLDTVLLVIYCNNLKTEVG